MGEIYFLCPTFAEKALYFVAAVDKGGGLRRDFRFPNGRFNQEMPAFITESERGGINMAALRTCVFLF
jgi:hypothetical protein